nr:MAG TPA: shock protein B [Caudoviricetes sp.]
MKSLNRITKWFFNTTKIEVNTDWRLVALDTNRELIDLQEKYQQANQRIEDLEKIVAIYEEKENTK